jgi:hypothetical protein
MKESRRVPIFQRGKKNPPENYKNLSLIIMEHNHEQNYYLEDDDQFQQSHKNQEKLNNFTIEIESEILAFLHNNQLNT